MERYLRVNLLGPGPRLMKKRIYWAGVSRRLRNIALQNIIRHAYLLFLIQANINRCDYSHLSLKFPISTITTNYMFNENIHIYLLH